MNEKKNFESETGVDSYAVIDETLAHAQELLTGERARDYGDPAVNHQSVADLWAAYLGHPVTPQDVTIMMALMKIARLKGAPAHKDSMVDAVAYMAIGRAHQEHAAAREAKNHE